MAVSYVKVEMPSRIYPMRAYIRKAPGGFNASLWVLCLMDCRYGLLYIACRLSGVLQIIFVVTAQVENML